MKPVIVSVMELHRMSVRLVHMRKDLNITQGKSLLHGGVEVF